MFVQCEQSSREAGEASFGLAIEMIVQGLANLSQAAAGIDHGEVPTQAQKQ